MGFDKNIDIVLSYILAYISYISSQKKILSFQEQLLTQILLTNYYMSFQRTFYVKLREQACIPANGRFWSELKWSV